MSKELVFDIETQNTFDDVGSGNHRGLRVSVVGVYTYEDDQYRVFREDNLKEMWPLFERAERLIGFNQVSFDVPVLQNYYAGDLMKIPQLDILAHIHRALGFRVKLDDIAKSTLNTAKSAHGLQAVEWFKHGEWEKIEKYCLDDVRITREVYEFGKKNRQLYYPDLRGGIRPVPVVFDLPITSESTGAARTAQINMTLPL